ncbi:MAG: hypothetical protein HYT76_04265 [Deltaproteobacteria bacterium]|nr:hypothetical protein [Deltaproteobacteria bacterium]
MKATPPPLTTDNNWDMVSLPADLERSYKNLEQRFVSLVERNRYFTQKTNSFIRGIADRLSGAQEFRETYSQALWDGSCYLNQAKQELASGNRGVALSALREADRYLDRAELFWGGYLRTTRGGAESAETGLSTLSKGFLVMGGVGLGAVALGLGVAAAASMAVGGGLIGAFFGSGDGFGLLNPLPEKEEKKQMSLLGPGATRIKAKKDESKKEEKKPLLCEGFDGKGKGIKGGERCLTPEVKEIAFEEIEKKTRPASPVAKKDLRPLSGVEEIVTKIVKALTEFGEKGISSLKIGRTLLDYDKATDKSGMTREYFSFLAKDLDKHLDQYRKELAEVSDWREKVKLLRELLFRDYFFDYRSGQASFLGLLDKHGGNCEARTKLFLYAMEELGIPLPEGWRFAVQRYQGEKAFDSHIEPVLVYIDAGTKEVQEVWHLVDNQTFTEANGPVVRAPIFDPHYLLFGLLLAQGVTPPIPFEKLLIASPPPELLAAQRSATASPAGEAIKTNSNLILPGGAGSYSDSPPPERAFSTSSSGGVELSTSDPRLKGLLDALEKGPIDMRWEGAGENVFKIRVMNDGERQVYRNSHFVVHYDTTRNQGGIDQILFYRGEDAATFIFLPTMEKKKFLLHLAEQSISEMLTGPTYHRAKALLERPGEVMRREEVPSIRSAIKFLKDIGTVKSSYAGHIAAVEKSMGVQTNPNAAGEYNELLSQIPSYQYLDQQERELYYAIYKSPENFIVLMDRFPPERRQLFMDLVQQLGGAPEASHWLAKAIANRRLIGVGRREGFEPLKVKVNLVYMPNSPVDLPTLGPTKTDERPEGPIDQKGQKTVGKKGERPFPSKVEARHYISASTMVDLILRFGRNTEVAARWNPSLTREFERMTRDEKRDREFLVVVPNLIRAYPKGARTKFIDTGETVEFAVPGGVRKKIFLNAPPDLARIIEEIRKRNPDAFNDLIVPNAKAPESLGGDVFVLER